MVGKEKGERKMKLNISNYGDILSRKGLSDEEVQKATGLSKMTYQWILDNSFIAEETLERIADAVGCPVSEIMTMDSDEISENTIEFVRDSKRATVTFSQGRYITRIKKLAESHPEECQIVAMNKDGSICAHIPVKWIRINPSMNLTEERRERLSEHARNVFRACDGKIKRG